MLFPRLLCQVLEHIGFPVEPRIERRRDCEIVLTVERWRARPRAFHLPPPGSEEDEPDDDSPRRDLSPIAEHAGGPLAPVSPVSPPVPSAPPATPLVALASVPQASMPSTSPKTSGPMPTVRSDTAGPSTSAQPPQYITLSARDFLALMEMVRTLSATTTSFAASQAALVERMTRIETSIAQIQASIIWIESHLGLPDSSPQDPAQPSVVPHQTGSPPPPPAPAASLDVLAAAATSASSPTAAPQPAHAKDEPSPATDLGGTTSSANFLISLLGQLVVEVMFILLMLVSLMLHVQQSPFPVI